MMEITVELPNDLTQHEDPAREALEALAIAGYRSGALSTFQARVLLRMESRFEFEQFLKDRNIMDHAYSVEDLDEDMKAIHQLEAEQAKGRRAR